MPASQTITDGKTATWPHDDPTRPGWTFNGWFQGDLAYDFTRPVTTDLTLTAKWGKWATSPDKGPWHGGTNVKIDTPGSQVRFSHISAGGGFSIALGSDGNAYGWGFNYSGQLGTGDRSLYCDAPRMAAMPDGVKFTQVSAGYNYAMALDRDGRIWTWGFDFGGNLGRPGRIFQVSPGLAEVPEGVTFTAVSAGNNSSMALDSNGQAWTWGYFDEKTPHKVDQDEGTVFTAIRAGSNPSKNAYTALDTDGRIWTWQWTEFKPVPVETDVRFKAYSIDYDNDHFIAIARDGTVWTWNVENNGNESGQLGRIPDSANPADKPGRVPGLTGATQVDTSNSKAIADTGVSLAITDTGVWAWGSNDFGQLGTGTGKITDTPARVVTPAGAPTGFRYTSIAAGAENYTVLLGSDGETYTYGQNHFRQLGNGTSTDSDPANPQPARTWRPVDRDLTKVLFGEARNIGGPYRAFDGWHATSPRHSLGTVTLTIQSAVTNRAPQPDETSRRFTYTGDTATVTFKTEHGSPTPPQQVIVGDTVRRPDDPATDDGWTFNGWFQGDKPYDFSKPVSGDTILTARWGRWKADPAQGPWRGGTDVRIDTPTVQVRLAQMSAGQSHSLAVGSDGNLYAWGNNQNGQLGNGTTTNQTTATKATTPTGTGFIQTAAGGSHSMALDRDGRIWTWGSNEKGQLGRTPDDNNPADRPGKAATPAGMTFIAVSAGTDHSTALDRDGNIWTWGDNQYSQLGFSTGTETTTTTPTGVGVPEAAFASVSAGARHSIGLDTNGTAWTWGGRDTTSNTNDDDLTGHTDFTPSPVDTGLRLTAVSAGADHSVGVARNGTVYTWGHNENGQLGRTPTGAEPAGRPGPVPGPSGATGVSAGRTHSVVLTGSGAWAWGGNQYGQLGTTTGNGTSDGVTPARVPNPRGTPSGFAYTSLSTSPVGSHTLAVGSDGDTYASGANGTGQLGTGTSDADAAHPDPAMVSRPAGSPVTGVLFGAKPSAGEVRRRTDGWHAASPRHRPETVPLTIRSGTGQARDEDTSLQFMYTGDMATLTFTTQHGRTPDTQQVPTGEPTRRPEDPSENGWTFDGWFNGDIAYDFTAPLEHDLTVTARWHRTGRWVLSPDHGSEYGDDTVTLTAPAAPDIRLASIDTGGTTSLGIGSDGQLYAWGDNTNGQLGDGTTTRRTTPVRVAKPDGTGDGFTWTQAAAGRTHSAAVGSDGNLYAWGDNTQGQLGDGTTSRHARPVKVSRPAGTDSTFTWIRAAAGDGYTMALGSDDNLYAWGSLPGGLGDTAHTTGSSRPVRVALPQD
ncbi:RCC1 domain-containing protein, partial [Bifidobacterium coryneforme]